MDTLSSSVSTIKLVSTSNSLPRRRSSSSSAASREPVHQHHLKARRSSSSSQPHHLISSSSGSGSGSISVFGPREDTGTSSPNFRRAASIYPAPAIQYSRRAATGYAAALIDAAQTDGSLQLLHLDVRRLSKMLRAPQLQEVMAEPSLSARDKGAILKQVVSLSGSAKKIHRHLTALLNMFFGKDKVDLIGETLDEFGRIYAMLNPRDMASITLSSN